jgi:hypothetical protein
MMIAPIGCQRGLALAGLGEIGGKLERGGELDRQCRPLDGDQRVHVALPKARYRRLTITLPSYISLQRYRQYVGTKMMTQDAAVAKMSRMGRKKRWPERTAIKFSAGTFERIAAILADGEDRMAFMRQAVERELERRQMAAARKKPKRRR